MTIVYIDGDNVSWKLWEKLAQAFKQKHNAKIKVFTLKNQTTPQMKTTCEENSISLYKIEPCTSNAVDFNICYHIGTMTHKCTNFYIVSDDNGFKAVKNLAATQNITITLLNQKPTKTQPNNCNHEQRMIAYLKSRHNNQATSVDFGTELSPKLHNLGSVQKFLQTTDCFTQNNSIIKLKA